MVRPCLQDSLTLDELRRLYVTALAVLANGDAPDCVRMAAEVAAQGLSAKIWERVILN